MSDIGLISNTEHVLRIFLPELNADCSYNSNYTIIITINIASELLFGNESYSEFKLTCIANSGGLLENQLQIQSLYQCGLFLWNKSRRNYCI